MERRIKQSVRIISIIILLLLAIFFWFRKDFQGFRDKSVQDELISQYQSDIQLPTEQKPTEQKPTGQPSKPVHLNGVRTVDDMIGILEIPSIQLKMPVLEGTSGISSGVVMNNLKISCSTLSKLPDTVLNHTIAIAGHMSSIKFHQFNQVPNIKKGDYLYFQVGKTNYQYQVISKTVISETDNAVILDQENKSLLTLITCYEDGKQRPDKRWCIVGELVKQ